MALDVVLYFYMRFISWCWLPVWPFALRKFVNWGALACIWCCFELLFLFFMQRFTAAVHACLRLVWPHRCLPATVRQKHRKGGLLPLVSFSFPANPYISKCVEIKYRFHSTIDSLCSRVCSFCTANRSVRDKFLTEKTPHLFAQVYEK